MNAFILFIVINGGGTTHVTAQEFSSIESCKSAKEILFKNYKPGYVTNWYGHVEYIDCLPK